MNQFLNINYLKTGSKRQQQAYKELIDLEIMEKLATYKPLLAGTIPIRIDISTSDLDIICTCKNHLEFSNELIKLFGNQNNFKITTKLVSEIQTTLAIFDGQEFPIEIFCQQKESVQQNAFRHMLVEHQILEQKGKDFKAKIITLKKLGVKTEPAFAQLLGLKGNPYTELLKYSNKSTRI